MTVSVEILSVHYKKLNRKCAYEHLGKCDGEVSIIRISVGTDGQLYVSTMCNRHAEGEKRSIIADGFVPQGQTSIAGAFSDAVLMNPKIGDLIAASIDELGKQTRDNED